MSVDELENGRPSACKRGPERSGTYFRSSARRSSLMRLDSIGPPGRKWRRRKLHDELRIEGGGLTLRHSMSGYSSRRQTAGSSRAGCSRFGLLGLLAICLLLRSFIIPLSSSSSSESSSSTYNLHGIEIHTSRSLRTLRTTVRLCRRRCQRGTSLSHSGHFRSQLALPPIGFCCLVNLTRANDFAIVHFSRNTNRRNPFT